MLGSLDRGESFCLAASLLNPFSLCNVVQNRLFVCQYVCARACVYEHRSRRSLCHVVLCCEKKSMWDASSPCLLSVALCLILLVSARVVASLLCVVVSSLWRLRCCSPCVSFCLAVHCYIFSLSCHCVSLCRCALSLCGVFVVVLLCDVCRCGSLRRRCVVRCCWVVVVRRCLFRCLFLSFVACLLVCLFACLFVCLLVCLFVCLYVRLSVRSFVR